MYDQVGMLVSGVISAVIICTIGFIVIIVKLFKISKFKDAKLAKMASTIEALTKENSNVVSHRKSAEVRFGKIAENMAPFFDSWPYNPNTFRFLGDPIDGIQFTDDSVIFVEIKSGNARLSKGQKHIKELVKSGKVSFATFRVSENGSLMRIEE